MREWTETVLRKGTHVDLGTIIRVLEVPATVPAETAPHDAPEPTPATPATVPATPKPNHAAEPALVPVRTDRSTPWVR